MSQVEIDWLVRPPDGVTFNAALASACRGSNSVGIVLNFFLYEAAILAKNKNIDKEAVEYVQLQKYTLDTIIAGMQRLNRTACKTTLIAYISKLKSWGFLKADGYRHTYDVYFKKIQEAVNNPPEPEQPKLRGRHAHRQNENKHQEETTEDFNFNRDVKNEISKIRAQNEDTEILNLTEEISNLKFEISFLRGEILNLQSEISNLKSLQSSETASREALEAKVDALYKVIYKSNKSNIKKEDDKRVATPTRSRQKTSSEKTVQPELPQSTEPDVSHLLEDELAVYNRLMPKHRAWYLKFEENGRHNYGIWLQKYKETTYVPLGQATVDTFNAVPRRLTLEELREIEQLAYELEGKYLREHGGFQIHNLLTYLNKWQALRERQQAATKPSSGNTSRQDKPSQEDENKLVPWTKKGNWEGNPVMNWDQFELMPIKEARQYGWTPGVFPLVDQNRIASKLRQAKPYNVPA